MKVIADSSLLINFTALGRFDLLHALDGTIAAPDAVCREVVMAGHGQSHAVQVERAEWIIRELVSSSLLVTEQDITPV